MRFMLEKYHIKHHLLNQQTLFPRCTQSLHSILHHVFTILCLLLYINHQKWVLSVAYTYQLHQLQACIFTFKAWHATVRNTWVHKHAALGKDLYGAMTTRALGHPWFPHLQMEERLVQKTPLKKSCNSSSFSERPLDSNKHRSNPRLPKLLLLDWAVSL